MNKLVLTIFFVVIGATSYTQDTILDYYIKTGLGNNLALNQKEASYQKSIYALKEAKGLFMPYLSLQARYSVADGGRVIEFPVGDLMNPVYSTLNQLTGGQNFPSIENEEINFLRPQEHETKLQLVQPIFNSQINYNKKIKNELVDVQQYNVLAYKRELISEIKKAYFDYLKTKQLIVVLEKVKILVEESIRVNQSLLKNDKVTIDAVYRSETELSKVEQQIAEAKKFNNVANAYFNFLLNRELDSDIVVQSNFGDQLQVFSLADATNYTSNREELAQLDSYKKVSENSLRLNKSNKLPTLSGVVDYGFQGEQYRFGADDDFVMASLVLRWDLFKGFQSKYKIQQAKIDLQNVNNVRDEVSNQLKLLSIQAFYSLKESDEAIDAAKNEVKTARKVYEIIDKKYKQGQANLLELIDARTTLSNAEQNLVIKEFEHYKNYAEFERVTASVDLNKYSTKSN